MPEPILRAVEALGYTEPTPVQEQAIPAVLEGRDVLAAAKTGTGKTAAFSLPGMANLEHHTAPSQPRMLAITPTRELAMQIADTCAVIARETHHRIVTVVGGLSYDPQIAGLERGCDVLIATPGRLIDLMHQNAVDLSAIDVLVLDEADRMLDMGFWPQVSEIIDATPEDRQTLLFSATIDATVDTATKEILNDPVLVEIAHKGDVADTIDQYIIRVQRRQRPDLLTAILRCRGSQRVIVFTRTKGCADNCVRRLRQAGITAEAIHANRSQNQRKHALENFREGITDVIVATDVLARGIDISEVTYVINYDLPEQIEDYVHRIGRTGRAGEAGCAISFVMPETKRLLKDIQKFIKMSIPKLEKTAEEYIEEAAAMPVLEPAPDPSTLARSKRKGKNGKGGRDGRRREGRKNGNRNGGGNGRPEGKGSDKPIEKGTRRQFDNEKETAERNHEAAAQHDTDEPKRKSRAADKPRAAEGNANRENGSGDDFEFVTRGELEGRRKPSQQGKKGNAKGKGDRPRKNATPREFDPEVEAAKAEMKQRENEKGRNCNNGNGQGGNQKHRRSNGGQGRNRNNGQGGYNSGSRGNGGSRNNGQGGNRGNSGRTGQGKGNAQKSKRDFRPGRSVRAQRG